MLLIFRVRIIDNRLQEPGVNGGLPLRTLPDAYATATEAIDAGQKFITDNGYAPGEAFCEITDMRGLPDL